MLQKPLIFVDIETTGSTIGRSRIIEIAIIRIENNSIVEEFQSLVDPETSVDSFITGLTGITNRDLKDAEIFPLVYKKCAHLFEGAIFVAHNASFDYNFIKSELTQIGYNFSIPRLCTVRLSRKLYPQYKSHSLEQIIERHGIQVNARHRAMDDIKATWDWWQIAHKEHDHSTIFSHIQSQLKKQTSLTQIESSQISKLPKTPGVYIFYNQDHVPLYVGKSINIQERVVSHINSAHLNKTDFKLTQLASFIKGIPTAGELSALLLESSLVKELQPLYNRKLRQNKRLFIAYEEIKANYKTVNLVAATDMDFSVGKIIGIFTSKKAAHDYFHELSGKHKLCKYLLGVDKTCPCFGRQLEQCKGACEGLENPLIYNLRFDMAFTSTSIKPWPFTGPKTITEYNPEFDLEQKLTIVNWVVENELPSLDTYKILKSYFAKK